MEKNILKWYEAPQVEIVEMEMQSHLLEGSGGFGKTDGEEEDGM